MFDTDNYIYYACLYPSFDWFEKIFAIKKLVEPQRVKITKQSIYPESIEKDDRFFLSRIGFSNVTRKYSMHIYMDNDEKFTAEIYENSDKKAIVVYENHVTVGSVKSVVEEDFHKMIIQSKADLEFDNETTVVDDDKFDLFRTLYKRAAEIYPEEVIKSHDNKQKNV